MRLNMPDHTISVEDVNEFGRFHQKCEVNGTNPNKGSEGDAIYGDTQDAIDKVGSRWIPMNPALRV
jgi:hypothetical protein